MTVPYTCSLDLVADIQPPSDGTLSRTLFNDERLKAVLFAFSAGQELSEHTAATPAVMHFLDGEAEVTLGDERVSAGAGTWIHMQPHLKHSIRANTAVRMLLLLLK